MSVLPWSAQQCEWLQALGHPALVMAGGDREPFAGDIREQAAATTAADPGAVHLAAAAPPRATPGSLRRALLRATGRADGSAEQVLRELDVDADGLRGDPAAKRALWPRLRGMRRQPPR